MQVGWRGFSSGLFQSSAIEEIPHLGRELSFRAIRLSVYTHSHMRRFFVCTFLATFLLVFEGFHAPAQSSASRHNGLLIYSIDVEGGQATLLVAPSGASMLVDTGWPGSGGRD